VPRRAAGVTDTTEGVLLADGTPMGLTGPTRRLFDLADGTRTVADLVAEVAPEPAGQVRATLARLRGMGLLTGGLLVPRRVDPETPLRGQLARVGDPARRRAAQADLAGLVAARDRVAEAAGDPDRLGTALDELDRVFVGLTGTSASQKAGQFYAGRTVAYEDCLGALPVHLGTDLLEPIRPALELMLHGAAWFTRAVARAYEDFVADLVTAREPTPGAGVPLAAVLAAVAESTAWGALSPADAVADRLRRTWYALLVAGAQPGQRRITRSSAELRPAAAAAFAHEVGGWRGSRLYSPDLMIAAGSAEEFARGRYLAVLGELHPAHNTMDALAADAWHPQRQRWHAWLEASGPAERMVPLYPLEHEQINSRTVPPSAYLSPDATYLGLGTGAPYHPRGSRLVPVSALHVTRVGDRVVVTSRTDPGQPLDLAVVLGDLIANAAATRFGVLPGAAHRPRVRIDDLVVQRESWTLRRADLPAAGVDREQGYAGLRAVAAQRGMPRHLFVTVTGERKPFHLDLDNPLSVEVLLSRLRRHDEPGTGVTFVEMLPDPDQLWLTDPAGRRYTAEFRIVCVDRRGDHHPTSSREHR
jgi:hypothetical protein